ncbi:MAG: DUF1971 domain-containing protein [Methylohalobius sp. ZOD2]|nr:DUF1971 domain-containing protein [Methylothermaceae bacterium]
MRTLPDGLVCYKKTPEFTEQTMPPGLTRSHRTAAGVWGVIRVREGTLKYRILPDPVKGAGKPEEHLLDPDYPGVIEPETAHEVEAMGPVRFQVEFYR